MPDKNVLPTTDERLDENLHLAIIGLRQTYGHIEDAMNIASEENQADLSGCLGDYSMIISGILSGKDMGNKDGLVKIREDIKAKIKAEESK